MVAIEVPEANRTAERRLNITSAEIADVRLDRAVAFAREPVARAMRMKQIEQAFIRPVERVDAERALARCEPQSHRDEEAALERADFRDVPRDAEFALAADDVPANRRGKRRRHAAHGLVARGNVPIDFPVAGTKRHASS